MKKNAFFCILGIMIFLTNSCGASPQISPNTNIGITETANTTSTSEAAANAFAEKYGINVSVTGDEKYPVLAVGENGEQLVAITDSTLSGSMSTVTGAVWFSPEGESFALFNGKDGLPEKVVVGEITIIFFNYTDSTVDVGIIGANGETETLKNISLDADILSGLKALQSKVFNPVSAYKLAMPAFASEITYMEAILEIASFGLGLAGCVAAAVPLAAVTFGAILVALALPCGTFLINTIMTLTRNESAIFASGNMGLESRGCIMGKRLECAALIIDATKLAVSKASELISNLTDEISLAHNYFSIGIYEGTASYTNKTDICTCDDCNEDEVHARIVISQDGNITGEVVPFTDEISGSRDNITSFYSDDEPNNCGSYCTYELKAELTNNDQTFTGTWNDTCTPGDCAFDNCEGTYTIELHK